MDKKLGYKLMKIYMVGGAVRDEILGRDSKDQDYVVVGSSEEEMLRMGFTKVGKDFPVFLHPRTKQEYALARKEQKIAPGHKGFSYSWENVSLEEDLLRRDLTINAIAKDMEAGTYIDPYGGVKDLENKVLRHVSDHFREDPLRVLRIGRFLATYEGFVVADQTKEMCLQVSKSSELETLTGERVWNELSRALLGNHPEKMFEFLLEVEALQSFFPELSRLKGVPQTQKYHPEGDAWTHTMLVLKSACELSPSLDVRFAALVHDLGKGETPKHVLPSHHQHEFVGAKIVSRVCDRFRVPARVKRLAVKVAQLHLNVHRCFEMKPGKLIKLLKQLEALRNQSFFEKALIVCRADSMGKLTRDYPQADFLSHLAQELKMLDIETLVKGQPSEKIEQVVLNYQISTIKQALKNYHSKV